MTKMISCDIAGFFNMACEDQKICTQFYPDELCEKFILSFNAHSPFPNKQCAHFFSHTLQNEGHILHIYTLSTDNFYAEGVKCTFKIPAQILFPGVHSPFHNREEPYFAKHPYRGEIYVLPRQHIPGFGLYRTQKMCLELDSSSPSRKDIENLLEEINFFRNWILPEKGRWYSDGNIEVNTAQGPPDFLLSIKLQLGYNKRDACESFEEFKNLFSLSCLYVEHKICKSLHKQGKHNYMYAQCMVCTRKENFSERLSREIKHVWNDDRTEICVNDDLLLKTELIFDFQAIGFNVYGSQLMINGKPCASKQTGVNHSGAQITLGEIKNVPMKHIPMYVAIAGGHVSWIRALIAVGIQLKADFPHGALAKHALTYAPVLRQLTIVKVLLANGAELNLDAYYKLYDRASTAIRENDHGFLQWLMDLGFERERDLPTLIIDAAGFCKPKCLMVRSRKNNRFFPVS